MLFYISEQELGRGAHTQRETSQVIPAKVGAVVGRRVGAVVGAEWAQRDRYARRFRTVPEPRWAME